MGLSFTIAAGPRHRSPQVRVPQDSWPHFTVSDSRLPQPGGRVTLRLTVSQWVCLCVEPHLGLMTRFFMYLLWKLQSCQYGAPSLTRGRVCRFNLEGQVPVFMSPKNRVVWLYPQALASLFVASYDSQSYGGSIRPRLHTCLCTDLYICKDLDEKMYEYKIR
jgi:hypothetical protein